MIELKNSLEKRLIKIALKKADDFSLFVSSMVTGEPKARCFYGKGLKRCSPEKG